jgi:hypothetical protein
MGASNLGLPTLYSQIKAIKNQAGASKGFQPSQIGF